MYSIQDIIISDILAFLKRINENFQFIGNERDLVKGYSSIYDYKDKSITWAKSFRNYYEAKDSIIFPIKLIILPKDFQYFSGIHNCIITDDPKRVFFSILEEFYSEKKDILFGINNVISNRAIIGRDVCIGNNCTIGDGVEIGADTKIFNNVIIYENVKIGRNCTIKSGAVIGEIGHGYMEGKNGEYRRVPHLGSVVIGDNVDIGSNTTIERGTIENTIIDNGVKIDDLCQISHNTHIGENTMIIVHSAIYGSTKIGKNCLIASSIVRNQVKIGDNVIIGMGSVVTKDIKSNIIVFGNPARER